MEGVIARFDEAAEFVEPDLAAVATFEGATNTIAA
jgi:hypothetical protein